MCKPTTNLSGDDVRLRKFLWAKFVQRFDFMSGAICPPTRLHV
ncbi:hypothetical protein V3C99_010974 [Haemonchus contortus]|uniref:Uncharacterized protein n=1 Tax=Haemonchus contortus TaxID=6289 RepID=A0A7I4Y6T0_HAECO